MLNFCGVMVSPSIWADEGQGVGVNVAVAAGVITAVNWSVDCGVAETFGAAAVVAVIVGVGSGGMVMRGGTAVITGAGSAVGSGV